MVSYFAVTSDDGSEFERRVSGECEGTANIIRLIGPGSC